MAMLGDKNAPDRINVGSGSVDRIASVASATIERQSTSRQELVIYSVLLIVFDVGKLITSYALKYFNEDAYPVPQTLIVFLTEDTKLVAVIGYLMYSGSHRDVSLSLKFALPSTLYAVTNNLYLYAFHYTTPAVWNILTQSRIIITALVYRIFFKKSISLTQWLSLVLLTFAISITQLAGNSGTVFFKPFAILLAIASSLLSVAAAVFMEYSFKNDKRSFMDQQLQLCLYAALASLVLYRIEVRSDKQVVTDATAVPVLWQGSHSAELLLPLVLVVCIALGAVSGLLTGLVIKRLDNIVKIYSQALCGAINAILCMAAFPAKFAPDWRYFVSLFLVMTSIFMYEKSGAAQRAQESTERRRSLTEAGQN